MKTRHILELCALAAAVALVATPGCSSDDDETAPGGTGGTGAVGGGGTGGTGGSGGTGGTGATGGGGTGGTGGGVTTSCDDAIPLEEAPSDPTILIGEDDIDPAGNRDYFSFEAADDDWVLLWTEADPDDQPGFVDTVIALYKQDGASWTQVALDDDAFPRASKDSEMIYHVPSGGAGTYCVEVLEWSDWTESDPLLGDPDFNYLLAKTVLDFSDDRHNLDTGDNDTIATAQSLTATVTSSGQHFCTISGMLDPLGDVDVYSFTTPAAAILGGVYFSPEGPGTWGADAESGFGSTNGPGLVSVLLDDGSVYAQLDFQMGSMDMSVPLLAETDYFLMVEQQAGLAAVGANDFYNKKLGTGDTDNEREAEFRDAAHPTPTFNTNDTAATAETPTPQTETGVERFFVRGEIFSDGVPEDDVDYWALPVSAGHSIVLACSGWRSGSGAHGLKFSVLDPSEAELDTEVEAEDDDVYWGPRNATHAAIVAGETGNFYLRVELDGTGELSPTVSSRYYLCGVHVFEVLP